MVLAFACDSTITSGLATLIPTSVFGLRPAIGRWMRIDGAIQSGRSEPPPEASRAREWCHGPAVACQLRDGPERAPEARLSCGRAVLSRTGAQPRPEGDPRLDLSPYGEIGLMLIIFAETGPADRLLPPRRLAPLHRRAPRQPGQAEPRGGPDRLLRRRGDRRPGRLHHRPEGRARALPAAGLAVLQTGVRRPHRRVLRAARPEDHRARAVRARSCARSRRCSPASARCRAARSSPTT